MSSKPEITVSISTKDRYNTTLPLAIVSIAQQTYKPKKILIFDDGEQKDLRQDPLYNNIFGMLWSKGIDIQVIFGERKGQVLNHQKAIDIAQTEWLWRCFRGNQKVETIDGLKNIRDIEIGELVKTHKGRYKKVLKTYKHYYKQKNELLWIYTNNSIIKCTPEHPFLVLKNNMEVWTKASNLDKDSVLLYPYDNKKDIINLDCFGRGAKNNTALYYSGKFFKNEYFGKFEVDEDLARFFGLYLAEGCGGHDSIRFTFNNKETEFINFITRICKDKFNRSPTIHSRWATCIKLNIKSFAKKFTDWFGDDATNKKVPDFVFNWSLKNKLAFLQGYLDGDGWQNQKRYLFGTASRKLFDGIRKLCLEIGLDCTDAYESPPKESSYGALKIKSSGCFSGTISSMAYSKMLDIIQAKIVNNYCSIIVKKIEKKRMPIVNWRDDQYVYNLEVEDDNSYIVGPCICHNCDDDDVVEPDVLEKLVGHIADDVAAISGIILNPGQYMPLTSFASNKIEHVLYRPNIQWFRFSGVKEVDHLNNSFLFRRELAKKNPYCLELSPVGHREETMFTYGLKKAGYKLLVDGSAVIWHLRSPSGGIRSYEQSFFWEHDEKIFLKKMAEIGVKFKPHKIIVLDCGLGDNFAFKMILPEIKQKYKDYDLILSVCYPEVFEDDGIELISIADAKQQLSQEEYDKQNIYRWMIEHSWKKNISDAYRGMLL